MQTIQKKLEGKVATERLPPHMNDETQKFCHRPSQQSLWQGTTIIVDAAAINIHLRQRR